ncbi:MAG: M57 family metalloprotease, partial [Candidatus Bathyarchaeia archaeon]
MKITNKTDLQNDQLSCFIREVAKREMVNLKGSVFHVVYRRGGRNGIAGYAYYGLPARVTLKIPKDFQLDKVELAYVIAHEFCHTQGLRHNQMKNAVYSRRYADKNNIDWRQHYL